MTTRSELKRQYKEQRRPMGVFVVRHARTGRFDVRASLDVQAAMNRLQVEVTPSTNPNLQLQRDWREDRAGFEVKVLDLLEPKEEPGWDPRPDLDALAAMWRERLVAEGGVPY